MIAIIDCRASEKLLSSLSDHGVLTISLPPSPCLQTGVASHTDMLIFIGFGKLFCHTSYYNNNRDIIDRITNIGNLTLSLSNEDWASNYPHDVLFNACLVDNMFICNEKTVSKHILNYAREAGAKIINVNQGYTKCSTCIVSERAIITSDKNIEKVCRGLGMDVLLISEGHISLPPYNFGFIGGASGLCCDNVYFCGSLSTHPDGNTIDEFCTKHGKKAISLSDDVLQDVGSIFFIGE